MRQPLHLRSLHSVSAPLEISAELKLLALAYFAWGALRSLSDVLGAAVQSRQPNHDSAAMLVHTSFFSSYLLVPLPTAALVRRCGERAGLALALSLMCGGGLACGIALRTGSLPLCFAALPVIAAGIAALQTAGNTAIMGRTSRQRGAQHLLIVQGFSSLGSIAAPLLGYSGETFHQNILTLFFIASNGYLIAGGMLLVLVLVFAKSAVFHTAAETVTKVRKSRVIAETFPATGVVLVFLFVGTETTILSHLIAYWHVVSHGSVHDHSLVALSLYWFFVAFGRLAGSRALRILRAEVLLNYATWTAFALVLISFVLHGGAGLLLLTVTGLANAAIFPLILAFETASLSQEQAAARSGWLTTAICGGAVMPLLSGLLADRFGIHFAFLLPLVSYAGIGFQAWRWSVRSHRRHSGISVNAAERRSAGQESG